MGAPEPVHLGQRLANERTAQTTEPERAECSYCTKPLGSDGDGRGEVAYTPPDNAGPARTRRYCSPSCFIRDFERSTGIEPDT